METTVSKHTPGPWKIRNWQQRPLGNGPERESYLTVYAQDWGVCNISALEEIDMPASEANAHLIASAPTMLEAIRSAIAALTQNKTYPSDIALAVKNLQEAIPRNERVN